MMAEDNTPVVQLPAKEPQPALPPPAAMQELLIELTDLNWEQNVEKNGRPVAVMFYSPTCPFCHQIEPYFRNYAGDYRKTVQFARLNIMTSPWTAERYGVRSTPTFTFFCAGKPVQEIVGAALPALLKKQFGQTQIRPFRLWS